MKLYFLLAITLFFAVGCLANNNVSVPPTTNTPTACTQEAKICPDGSAVGRSGPNCEFAPCPEMPKQSQNLPITFPVKEFAKRITKKPFGIYITPETSPVQPERFQGYHTGVDVEYADTAKPVPVLAITNGEVIFSDWLSGYGGVVVIKHTIDMQDYTATYGHLNPDLLPKKNSLLKSGVQISVLGKGGTRETDKERKHLHFALHKGTGLNLKGYVLTKEGLNSWIDPTILFP